MEVISEADATSHKTERMKRVKRLESLMKSTGTRTAMAQARYNRNYDKGVTSVRIQPKEGTLAFVLRDYEGNEPSLPTSYRANPLDHIQYWKSPKAPSS